LRIVSGNFPKRSSSRSTIWRRDGRFISESCWKCNCRSCP
jgi:hypothetical protein